MKANKYRAKACLVEIKTLWIHPVLLSLERYRKKFPDFDNKFIYFRSKKEAKRYIDLVLLQRAGEISNLQTQVRYPLTVRKMHVCDYIADFRYTTKDGKVIIEDAKGMRTQMFNLKRKLFEAIYEQKIILT